ncbi:hypothetical protein II582_03725 [bacterium]|nr:hypothetical protein [bacterium]
MSITPFKLEISLFEIAAAVAAVIAVAVQAAAAVVAALDIFLFLCLDQVHRLGTHDLLGSNINLEVSILITHFFLVFKVLKEISETGLAENQLHKVDLKVLVVAFSTVLPALDPVFRIGSATKALITQAKPIHAATGMFRIF